MRTVNLAVPQLKLSTQSDHKHQFECVLFKADLNSSAFLARCNGN